MSQGNPAGANQSRSRPQPANVPRLAPLTQPRSGAGAKACCPSIEVQIEELMLHGFAPADRHRIGDAVERELARLFAEQKAPSLLAHDGEIAFVNAGSIQIKPHTGAAAIGNEIARAVYRGLTG